MKSAILWAGAHLRSAQGNAMPPIWTCFCTSSSGNAPRRVRPGAGRCPITRVGEAALPVGEVTGAISRDGEMPPTKIARTGVG